MKTAAAIAALAGLVQLSAAQAVVGKAEGFAAGVTGGGDAAAVRPANIEELTKLLTDENPQVIVLDKEFDYTESEGTETGNVCASWGTGDKCQKIIQESCDGGDGYEATWFKAPTQPIDIASHKTIIGEGSKGVIKGKGLRVRGGATNVIMQNFEVTDLNHEFVWGGDAISFDEADLVWVDHVTTTRPGRQHYCFGHSASKRITLSNNFVNGESEFSTGCDGYHYWTFEMVGADDQITMQNNYIYHTAGRSPALSENTLLHAVNNVWDGNTGHALEGGSTGARGIFEGNVFIDVKQVVGDYEGRLFSAPEASVGECQAALGRDCEINVLDNSEGDFDFTDTSFFTDYEGLEIAPAVAASEARTSVPQNAGAGKLSAAVSTKSTETASKPAFANAESVSSVASKPAAEPTAKAAKSAEPEKAESKATDSGVKAALYGQCGGQGYSGPTACAEGKCVKANAWYSQCV